VGQSARPRLGVTLLVLCSTLLFCACNNKEKDMSLDFAFALPPSWQIVKTAQLDTNEDGENEWVILYSFDQLGNSAFTPIGCVAYHISRREPKLPVLYPYHLQAPGRTYLGEGTDKTSVRVENVVDRINVDTNRVYAATREVIVESTNASGFVGRVAIFQWRDNVQNNLIDPNEVIVTAPGSQGSGQWYQALGLFEGSLRVELGLDRVVVWDRLNERSQFARISTYEPGGGPNGYLDENNQPIPPVSSCIDFAFGLPANATQSPYPEKVVMAFQRTFTAEPDFGAQFLTAEAEQRRQTEANWNIFGPQMRSFVRGICVKQVVYNPTEETQVIIKALAQGDQEAATTVQTWAEYSISGQPTASVKLAWELRKVDDLWKINDVRPVP
jgi:hypothetical protein